MVGHGVVIAREIAYARKHGMGRVSGGRDFIYQMDIGYVHLPPLTYVRGEKMEIKPSPMMLIIKLALLLFAATMVLGFRTPLGVGIAVGAIVLEQWLNYKTDQYKQKRR